MKVDQIGKTRIGRLVVLGLVGISIATAYALSCDCPISTEPIARGALVVEDPESAVSSWRLGRELNAEELNTVKVREDDRTVDISFLGGNREAWLVAMIAVSETRERVVIGIYGGYHRQPDGVFYTTEGVGYRLTLRLDNAVAGREISSVERLSSPFDR